MNARGAVFASIALVSGCDRVFGVHGAADGGPIDAPADAGPIEPCSSITMLSDPFDTDDIATRWPTSYATNDLTDKYLVKDNELQLFNLVPDGHVIISSPFFFDFRGKKFSFKLTDNGSLANNAGQLVFSLDSTHFVHDVANNARRQRHLDIYRFGTRIQARATTDSGSIAMLADLDYDPTAHAYVRIGLEGTQAVFETSPDGVAWKKQGSTLYDGMDFVQVKFDAYRNPLGGEVAVSISDILGGVANGTACKMNTLVDTFDGTELTELWANSVQNIATMSVGNGLLHVDTPDFRAAGTPSLAVLASSLPYDLSNSEVVIDVVQPLAVDAAKYIRFAIGEYAKNDLQMTLTNGRLTVLAVQAGQPPGSPLYDQLYDPATQHWWRIQNTTAGTTFDVSADGKTWATLALNVSTTPPAIGLVTMAVGSGSPDPDEARFDNVNSAPP
ncbi:MAG TPA: hypothetical protein VGM90_02955 [Kofleriaceae bacterium]